MLLNIYNLPGNVTYNEVKELIWKNCGLEHIILDKLTTDKSGSKRVTVGLAEESDAAILTRKINGVYINGHQLYVENVRQKKELEQPYAYSEGMQSGATSNNSTPQANMPVTYNMDQYAMYYGNMSYFTTPTPNAMMQPQPPSNPPLYQNNVPFYQQAQNTDFLNPTFYQQSLRISVPNTEMNKGAADTTTFQQQKTPQNISTQGQYNSKDKGQNYDQYYQQSRNHDDGRDRGHNRERNDERDRNASRDFESRYSNREDGDRRKKKFRHRDQKRHQAQERDNYTGWGNSQSNESNLPPKNPYKVDHRGSKQSKPYDPSIMENIKVTYKYKDDVQGTQSNFEPSQGNSQQGNQSGYVESKFKRKADQDFNFSQNKQISFGARTPQQQQRFVAPQLASANEQARMGKRPKYEELDETQRRARFESWVVQCASTIARGMVADRTPPKKLAGTVLKELRKSIISRIYDIFQNRNAIALPQVTSEYRDRYPLSRDEGFFYSVLRRVKKEKFTDMCLENNSASSNMTPDALVPQAAQHSNILNQGQDNKPTETVIKPKSKFIPSRIKNVPGSGSQSGTLPSHPNASKKQSKQNKEENMKAFLGCTKFNLPKHQQVALDAEIKDLGNMFTEACQEVDQFRGMNYSQLWVNGKEHFLKTMQIQVSRRLLKMTNCLMVRVAFKPKKPSKEALHDFLKRYDVISVKKSQRNKLYVACCSTFKGFDALCKVGETFLDGATLRIFPLHMTGPQPHKLAKAENKMKKQRFDGNESWDDNNDDDDNDGSDDDNEGSDDDNEGSDNEDFEDESFFNEQSHIEEPIIDHIEKNNDNTNQEDNDVDVKIKTEKDTQNNQVKEIKHIEGTEHSKNDEGVNNETSNKEFGSSEQEISSDIVVGDKNYVVLDDLDDDDSKTKTNIDDKSKNDEKVELEVANITEEDLEDF